jgi:hypothetical protein
MRADNTERDEVRPAFLKEFLQLPPRKGVFFRRARGTTSSSIGGDGERDLSGMSVGSAHGGGCLRGGDC